MQATSKEKRSNLRARRVLRPVWIGPKQKRPYSATSTLVGTFCAALLAECRVRKGAGSQSGVSVW